MDFSSNEGKVSFFELNAESSLTKYLRSALRYVFGILSNHYDSLIRFRYFGHEFALLIESALQLYYLRHYSATYSEYFFGFKRSLLSKEGVIPFTTAAKLYSYLFETFLPYLKAKTDDYFIDQQRELSPPPAATQAQLEAL